MRAGRAWACLGLLALGPWAAAEGGEPPPSAPESRLPGLFSATMDERLQAIRGLGGTFEARAACVPLLVAALDDGKPDVEIGALHALRALAQEAVPVLLDELDALRPRCRRAFAELARHAVPVRAADLVMGLEALPATPEGHKERAGLLLALVLPWGEPAPRGRIGFDPDAECVLRDHLDHADPAVRRSAAAVLALLAEIHARGSIAAAMNWMDVLPEGGEPQPDDVGWTLLPSSVTRLAGLVAHEHDSVAGAAVLLACALESRAAHVVDALARALERSALRPAAARALAALGRDAAPAVERLAGTRDPICFGALVRAGAPGRVAYALEGADPVLRLAAARALLAAADPALAQRGLAVVEAAEEGRAPSAAHDPLHWLEGVAGLRESGASGEVQAWLMRRMADPDASLAPRAHAAGLSLRLGSFEPDVRAALTEALLAEGEASRLVLRPPEWSAAWADAQHDAWLDVPRLLGSEGFRRRMLEAPERLQLLAWRVHRSFSTPAEAVELAGLALARADLEAVRPDAPPPVPTSSDLARFGIRTNEGTRWRRAALLLASRLGPPAAPLRPQVVALRSHPDRVLRLLAARTLRCIDGDEPPGQR